MPELDDIASPGVELADDVVEPGLGVAVARRKLEQEASHALAENVGDHPEIPDKRLGPFELLYRRNECADLDGVDKFLLAARAPPGLNRRDRRPGVKGCVDLDRVEAFEIVLEPVRLGDASVK